MPKFVSVEEIKQFPTVDRRRNPGVPSEQREAGEVAVFQELGKALTSSLQLDQVLRTIMEKIDEFLRPDNWSLLLLDESHRELGLRPTAPRCVVVLEVAAGLRRLLVANSFCGRWPDEAIRE